MKISSQQPNVNDPSAIVIVVLITAFVGLSINAQPVILGVAADDFSLTSKQIGFVAGAEMLGACLSSLVAIGWIRRGNWRTFGGGGLGVFIFGNLASAIPESFLPLAMIRCVVGVAIGGLFGLAFTMLGDTDHPDRSFAYSVTGQVLVGGLALWGIPYLAPLWGYSGVMVLLALGGLVLFPFISWLPQQGVKEFKALVGGVTLRQVVPVLTGLGALLVWYMGIGGLWAFLDRIGAMSGLESTFIGQALALGSVLSVGGSLLASWLDNRFGRFWPFLITLLGQGVLYVIFGSRVNGMAFLFAGLAFICLWNYGLAYMLAAIADADYDGRWVVLIVPTMAIGLTLGPVLVGWLVQGDSFLPVTYVGVASCVASLFLFTIFLSMSNRQNARRILY